jgi:enoyl-CoA hydratase
LNSNPSQILDAKEDSKKKTLEFSNVRVEFFDEEGFGIITLNRPSALNAISSGLIDDILSAIHELEQDDNVHSIILTGGDRAFSAGADIKEMEGQSPIEALKAGTLDRFDQIYKRTTKPLIAAVNGYCFGGGLELAMSCDIIICGENARLGQPEINIGVMPGAGGTQRLTRAIGKYKAMDLILTGRQISAREAYDAGLLSRIVPDERCLTEAIRVAKDISSKPPIAARIAKECLNKALEGTLSEGIEFERKNFYLLLATEDKAEGMKAFSEKRKPVFKGK